jgi:phosphoenolpyruvate synthase/pyruvate phosphate dikinase
MLQTDAKQRSARDFTTSTEQLLAIRKDLDRIQAENMRTWAALEHHNIRTRELSESMVELLSKQEETLKKLEDLAKKIS